MGERFRILGREPMCLRKIAIRLVRSALLEQVESEIHEIRAVRAGQLQSAPEVPFSGRQIVHLREHQTEQVVAVRAARIHAQRRARHLAGIRELAVSHEDLDQLVVGPIDPRIRTDHRVERLYRLEHLPAALLYQEAQLERVDIGCRSLEERCRRRLGGGQIAAPVGFPAAHEQGVRGFGADIEALWCPL